MLNCIKKGAAVRVTEVPIKERGRLQNSRSNQCKRQPLSELKPKIWRSCGMAESHAIPHLISFYTFTGARSNACMVVRIVEMTLSLPTAVLIIM